MQKFVIIYTGRCGSSLLQTLLDSHPEVVCMGELLHIGQQFNQSGVHAKPAEVFDFINQASPNMLALGFKLSLHHFSSDRDAMTKWVGESGSKCIHIKRQNPIDQYVSMSLAQLNDVWQSTGNTYSKTSFNFDAKACTQSALAWEQMDLFLENLALSTGGVSVAYEALVAHTSYICNYICENIAVNSSYSFSTPLVRQRSGTLREAIANIQDFI